MPSLSQNISIGIWVCSVYGCVRVCTEEGDISWDVGV